MSQTFPKSRQLHGPAAFRRVYDGRIRESRGALTIYALPNALPYYRLGLSLPRAVGNNVIRNRVKRLLRESFRLMHFAGETGYDLVITVRKHPPMRLVKYQQMLSDMVECLLKKKFVVPPAGDSATKRKCPPEGGTTN